MSTPAKPSASAPESLQPTRQLLDELDSLMQRMLALPVDQLEDELRAAAVPPEPEIPDSPATAVKDLPPPANYAGAGLPGETDAPEPIRPDFAPAAEEIGQPAQSEEAWEDSLPASPEVLAALGRPAPVGRTPGVFLPLPRPAADVPEALPAAWLRPLVWGNRAFDGCTAWLGGPGRWLRSDRGRAFLGWVGLGLLAGTFAWLTVNGLGWTP
jgi:hypothetical protein